MREAAITGPNSTTDNICQFNTSNVAPSFSQPNSNLSLITQYRASLNTTDITREENVYDKAVTNVYPIFTVLFPPANDSNRAGGVVSTAEAFLTCARPVNITAGSRIAAALPSATPLPKVSKPLSGGAKAGIAVGVIVGVALIAGIVAWLLVSRRRKRSAAAEAAAVEAEEKRRVEAEEMEREKKTPLLGGEQMFEAEGEYRPEIGGDQIMELEGSRVGELDGNAVVGELDGRHGGAGGH